MSAQPLSPGGPEPLDRLADEAPREALLRTRQEMVTLSYIAYTGMLGSAGFQASRLHAELLRLLGELPPVRDRWRLVWGPAVDSLAVGLLPFDHMLFAVEDPGDEHRVTVVVRGTNPVSLITMLFEVGAVYQQRPWPYGKPSRELQPKISVGVDRALRALLRLRAARGAPGAGDTLLEFLRRRVAGARGQVSIATTGHSLGGALASTLALCLADLQGSDGIAEDLRWDPEGRAVVSTTPIAGLSAGNLDFALYSDARLRARCDRLVNALDVTPLSYAAEDLGRLQRLYEPGIRTPSLFWWLAQRALRRMERAGVSYRQICRDAEPLRGTVREGRRSFLAEMAWQHTIGYLELLGLRGTIDAMAILRGRPVGGGTPGA
ncbi:hypothetical protein WME98_27785 [Sorangium sp. So ce296]|uniref:lipase family protein n=1 Tax=Sorangium sp. So ce296 TaxID=3133296 RepID=UPI00077990F9|nr:hypothetical protein BE20_58505 [Sorangium cellulosum]